MQATIISRLPPPAHLSPPPRTPHQHASPPCQEHDPHPPVAGRSRPPAPKSPWRCGQTAPRGPQPSAVVEGIGTSGERSETRGAYQESATVPECGWQCWCRSVAGGQCWCGSAGSCRAFNFQRQRNRDHGEHGVRQCAEYQWQNAFNRAGSCSRPACRARRALVTIVFIPARGRAARPRRGWRPGCPRPACRSGTTEIIIMQVDQIGLIISVVRRASERASVLTTRGSGKAAGTQSEDTV